MQREQEERIYRRIPDNYENGINFAGFSFKPIFLVEGIVLGVICFGITLLIISLFSSISSSSIGIALVPTLGALFLGIKGINDEPITTFLGNVYKFNKNKRIAYYNPRIRTNEKSIYEDDINKDAGVLPRDKIIAAFNKVKRSIAERSIEKIEDDKGQGSNDHMFFEDDIGVIDKPIEYMTSKEYRKYKSENKRKKGSRWNEQSKDLSNRLNKTYQ